MTITDPEQSGTNGTEPVTAEVPIVDAAAVSGPEGAGTGIPVEPGFDERPPLDELIRPAAAAAAVCIAAAFEIGGIYGSWFARLLGAAAAGFGAAGAVYAQRSTRRRMVFIAFPIALLVAADASLLGAPGGPLAALTLIHQATQAGSLLKPPVPFDPGWRAIIIFTLGLLGFAAAWIGTDGDRPKLGLALGFPVIALTAITQPPGSKLLAGLVPFVLIVAALALVFGGDVGGARGLGQAFEARRLIKAVAAGVPFVALVIGLNSASFLFPKPVHQPISSAQKPRLVSAPSDNVLFEVRTDAGFTGPWRIGVLDTYRQGSWLLPPQDPSRLVRASGGAQFPGNPPRPGVGSVTIVLHDLGQTAMLPDLAGTEFVDGDTAGLVVDKRTGVLQVPNGRARAGLTYTLHVPPYASTSDLEAARPAVGPDSAAQLQVPPPPPAVAALLASAPTANSFDRMEYVEHALLDNVTAKGAGIPTAVTPARVQDLLAGSKTGSPFEIVAAEALIARWAGVPSRIGFGYDGVNNEVTGVVTVRPHNAADWLEVDYAGYGWLPLVAIPKQAEQDLNNKPKQHQDITANDDIAVRVFVPYRIVTAKQLYEIVRYWLAVLTPVLLGVLLIVAFWPAAARVRRRSKRRSWAAARGLRDQIAVEYAEMRDAATDLNIGSPTATPLEYLFMVRSDEEHAELAWLTSRALYGDLADEVTEEDVRIAEELSTSVRRRLRAAQPAPSRLLAASSRASIRSPYEPAMPNVRVPRWRRARKPPRRRPARLLRRVSGWRRVGLRRPRLRLPWLGRRRRDAEAPVAAAVQPEVALNPDSVAQDREEVMS